MGVRIQTEPPVKITRPVIDAARKRREKGVRMIIRDSTCPGLALIVSTSSEIWRFDWRPRGVDPIRGTRWATQSVTIGTPGSHSADAARAEASRLRGQAKTGVDIGAERRALISDASLKRATTVESLLTTYEQELPGRPKLRGVGPMGAESLKAELSHLRLAVQVMGVATRPVLDLSVADISRMLAARSRQPATARHYFGALSRFLEWTAERGHIPINPCLRMPKGRRPRAVPSRPVCPSLADMAALWHAAEVLTGAERDVIRWLIAVPCRLREATCLEWHHVDWREQKIKLPAAMMKAGEAHDVHIPPFALGLIQARHKAAGKAPAGLVFPAVRSGKPINSTTKIKAAVSSAAGVAGWTIHDFRRGFASAAAEMGIAEPVADAILSHRQSATRAAFLACISARRAGLNRSRP